MNSRGFILLFLLTTNFLLSQNSYDSIVNHRILFSLNKTNEKSKIVVIGNDTLYDNYNKLHNLNYLNNKPLKQQELFRRYLSRVFCNTNKDSKVVYELKQWNEVITVYLDDELPKKVINDFKTFYNQINNIENLEINFTTNIEKANYFIKTTTEEINGYKKDYEFDSEEERELSILTGATYNLATDKNNKFYCGVLTINIKNPKDDFELLKQLKQLFFKSLGQFYSSKYVKDTSLLSKVYINTDTISEFDLNFLEIHYSIIYDQKINSTIFRKLMALAKNN